MSASVRNLRCSPAYPGIKALGWVPKSIFSKSLSLMADAGIKVRIISEPVWIALDNMPRIKVESSDDTNSTAYKSSLTFSSRDDFPTGSGIVLIAIDVDGRCLALGLNSYHPGTLALSSDTSEPGADPKTTSYIFEMPHQPVECSLFYFERPLPDTPQIPAD